MKKIFTMLFLSAMFALTAFAQKPEALAVKADIAPAIDGEIDEIWADANMYDIILPWQTEVTSLGAEGETYWSALWDDDGVYVLVVVADDVYYPWYAPDPDGGSHWKYDMVEIYFDVNEILEDGLGTTSGDGGNAGHYQFSADFVEGEVAGELQAKDGWEFAALVEDPTYNIEYFIPFAKLINEYDIGVDQTAPIGFDVYVADNDDVADGLQQRVVWVNTGDVDQAWANMDECGILLLEGAVDPTYIDAVTLADAAIDENNGTVMIEATVLPEEASNKVLKYSVENNANGTSGKAKVNADGSITAIVDGEVIVTGDATDGSYMSATCTLTITNQIVSRSDINLIRNGYFQDLNEDGSPMEWNEWGEGGTVTDGVYSVLPDAGANIWDFRLQQSGGWNLNIEDMYTLSMNIWAEESDTMNVDFEDARSEVSYNRYGISNHELSNGKSEWQWMSETERTKYVFDVQFTELIAGESSEQFYFMLGHHTPMVYIDSVELFRDDDMDLLTPGYIPVTSVVLSGVDGEMAVGATAQMSAAVLPAEATLLGVKWSVVSGTGYASISADGMLTADSAGVVSVMAMAADDSGVKGVLDVTIGGTGISQKSVTTLKVYPNPAVNELNVVLTSENSTVSIYNAMGQKMDQVVVSGSEYKFDISSYAAGIYFVKTGTSIAKFIK